MYRRHVEPILAGFHRSYPDITLDILVDDAVVDHVARHRRPETPKDLMSHGCICWRWPGRIAPSNWECFVDGAWIVVEVNGPLVLSDQRLTIQAAPCSGSARLLDRA